MIKKIAATPYNATESIGWIFRNIAGISCANPAAVMPLKSPCSINDNVKTRYKITAIGDIMPMRGHRVSVDPKVGGFIKDSDYLLGSFDGTVTDKRPSMWPIAFDQRHDASTLDDLARIFAPRKTYLSVASNHAGDFGEEEFFKSVGILGKAGFNVFGWDEKPFADINDDIRIVSGTMWSNRGFGRVFRLGDAGRHSRTGAFNILYPHMGYELELYPRVEVANVASRMLGVFNAVIAHHSHCPQPVTSYASHADRRLVAYSLGDFCTALKIKKMQYGLVIKIDVGQLPSGKWAVGKAGWIYTECVLKQDGTFTVRPMSCDSIFARKLLRDGIIDDREETGVDD